MEDFGTVITEAHMVAAALLGVLVAVSAFMLVRSRRAPRQGRPTFAGVARIVSVIVFATGVYFGLKLLLPLSMIAPGWLRTLIAALLIVLVGLEILRALRPNESRGLLASGVGVIVTAAMFVVGLFLLKDVPAIVAAPDGAEEVSLAPPFEGQWVAVHAGPSAAANHHVRIPEQNYAADLTMIGPNGDIRRGESDGQEDFWSFGAPIVSPADGVVALAIDGEPDGVIPKDWEKIAGNHVAIQIAPETYVLLAHFKEGSIVVKEGQSVRIGDKIGLSGNSGNSDLPHLHIHVQDRPGVVKGATALPWSMDGKAVTRNDVIESR